MFHFSKELIQKKVLEPILQVSFNCLNQEIELTTEDYGEDNLLCYVLEHKLHFSVLFEPYKVEINFDRVNIYIYCDPKMPYAENDTYFLTVYNGWICEQNLDELFSMVVSIVLAGINNQIIFRTVTLLEKHAVTFYKTDEEYNRHNLYQYDLYIQKDTKERYDLNYGNIFIHVNSESAPSSCCLTGEFYVAMRDTTCIRSTVLAYDISKDCFDSGKFREYLLAVAETGEYHDKEILSLSMKSRKYARSGLDSINLRTLSRGSGDLLIEITVFIDDDTRVTMRNGMGYEEGYRVFEEYYMKGRLPDLTQWTKQIEFKGREQFDSRKIVRW